MASTRRVRPRVIASAAALLAFGLPFLGGVVAWPEIVVPAYYTVQGSLLYDQIFFPHTPLLILATAAGGALLGFGPFLFSSLVGMSLAASAALVVLGNKPGPKARESVFAAVAAVPLLALGVVYFDGPALWPDPFMAPILLGAGLLLERFERRGRRRDLVAGGLLLGLAVLVKQTSAWVSLAALVWILLRSRRRSPGSAALLALAICAPYGVFAAGWAAAFGTVEHVRWTLLVPIQMGRAKDNLNPISPELLHEAIAPLLGVPALLLARAALPRRGRLRSALPWLVVGCFGMSYPRADLLHLSSTLGLATLASVRAFHVLRVTVTRRRARPGPLRTLATTSVAAALVVVFAGVTIFGAGPLALSQVGAPTRFWDDETGREFDAIVTRRVSPGDSLVLFNIPYDTLYVRSRTTMPGGVYVNTYLWDCVNKEGADGRVVEAIAGAPGTMVLFRDIEDPSIRGTAIYQFLQTRTEVVESLDDRTSWRRVAP